VIKLRRKEQQRMWFVQRRREMRAGFWWEYLKKKVHLINLGAYE